jgi:hypothetical protein
MADSIVGFIELWRSEEMQLVQVSHHASYAERRGAHRHRICPLLQMMVPSEAAHDTVAALGDLGLMQFKDLNAEKSAFQRSYASQVPASPARGCRLDSRTIRHVLTLMPACCVQVKRCDEMARKLRYLRDQVGPRKIRYGKDLVMDGACCSVHSWPGL